MNLFMSVAGRRGMRRRRATTVADDLWMRWRRVAAGQGRPGGGGPERGGKEGASTQPMACRPPSPWLLPAAAADWPVASQGSSRRKKERGGRRERGGMSRRIDWLFYRTIYARFVGVFDFTCHVGVTASMDLLTFIDVKLTGVTQCIKNA